MNVFSLRYSLFVCFFFYEFSDSLSFLLHFLCVYWCSSQNHITFFCSSLFSFCKYTVHIQKKKFSSIFLPRATAAQLLRNIVSISLSIAGCLTDRIIFFECAIAIVDQAEGVGGIIKAFVFRHPAECACFSNRFLWERYTHYLTFIQDDFNAKIEWNRLDAIVGVKWIE